jgi:catalase
VKPESWFRRTILDPLMLRRPAPPLPKGVRRRAAARPGAFANSHDYCRGFVIAAANSQVPVSWARTAYHAVHTFMALGPDATASPCGSPGSRSKACFRCRPTNSRGQPTTS